MIEFFIALFGGLYYGNKYASETSKIKAAQRDYEHNSNVYFSRKEEWMSRVVDKELEIQLEDFISRKENYNAVWQEVSAAFAEMPWNNGRNLMCFSPDDVIKAFGKGKFTKKERENISKNHRKEALRIMLARRGKLCYLDADIGIANCGFSAPTTLQMRQWNGNSSRFVLWINDQLKKHGIDEDLFIETTPNSAFPLASSLTRNGTYKWRPNLSFSAKIES